MGITSIQAIRHCMEDLGLSIGDKNRHEVTASLYNPSNNQSGNIGVVFCSNWHSNDGPFLEVGDEIKSFGISFLSFKPAWQDFSWDNATKELTVTGNGYEFTLEF
ncbi:TPA: hypothetical protein I7683_22845 [Vibrio vulnificus]|nr:hypothetical protein [Vibrio vulnificus]